MFLGFHYPIRFNLRTVFQSLMLESLGRHEVASKSQRFQNVLEFCQVLHFQGGLHEFISSVNNKIYAVRLRWRLMPHPRLALQTLPD